MDSRVVTDLYVSVARFWQRRRAVLVKVGLCWYRVLNRYMAPLQLEGDRLMLRSLVPADYEAWREVRERCHDWLARWQLRPIVASSEAEDSESFGMLCAHRTRWARLGTSYSFGIFVGGQFAGEIHLGAIVRGAYDSANLGYWVDQRMAGKGLAPEAAAMVLEFAFESLGLHRVEVTMSERNAASRRVVEKLGLRLEGRVVGYSHMRDGWEDCFRYAITAEEWDLRRGELLSISRSEVP